MVLMRRNQVLHDPRQVMSVRVVVHHGDAINNSDNHWSIYLMLLCGGCVRLNIVNTALGAELQWSDHDYLVARSAIDYWEFAVAEPFVVSDVADAVYEFERNRYMFARTGSGCRYWVHTIIKDLEYLGFIGPGSARYLWGPLQYLYIRNRSPERIDWVEGEFC